jgi:hypothetical protein
MFLKFIYIIPDMSGIPPGGMPIPLSFDRDDAAITSSILNNSSATSVADLIA